MNKEIEKHLLNILYEKINMGLVIVNTKGFIVDANLASKRILNLTEESIMHQYVFSNAFEIVDDQEKELSMFATPICLTLDSHEQVGPVTIGIRQRKEEELKWLSVTTIPIFDKHKKLTLVFSLFEDITESRKSEKKYELLFNEMLDGYALHEMIYDDVGRPKDYRFLAVNEAFKTMTGFRDQNIVGKTVLELLPNTEQYWMDTFSSVAKTGKHVWFEQYSGELDKTFEVKAFSPERDKFAVIATDISDRKAQENQMKTAIDNTENELKSKGRFLANVSHEIRTPINSILGVLSLLEFTKLDEEQSEYIHIARKAASILLDLVDDVLTLSKIESGKMTLEEKTFSIHEIVAGTWTLFANKAELKGVAFKENINVPDDALFKGDPSKLTQILMNLLSNAVKFTSNGHIEVIISQNPTDAEGVSELNIIIKDTGIGMSSDFVEKLFIPYHQEHRENELHGYGLGLVITKELVTLMNGVIYVESELGVGSIFTVKIPLKRVLTNPL